MNKSEVIIRNVKENEMDALIELCELHALFEGASYDSKGKSSKLKPYIFGKNSTVTCYVAVFQKELIGYITFTKEFSTWSANYYYHMDCLYLKEGARRYGVGKLLMDAMIDEAKKQHIELIQWQTPITNAGAIKFYHRNGATSKQKERFFLDL